MIILDLSDCHLLAIVTLMAGLGCNRNVVTTILPSSSPSRLYRNPIFEHSIRFHEHGKRMQLGNRHCLANVLTSLCLEREFKYKNVNGKDSSVSDANQGIDESNRMRETERKKKNHNKFEFVFKFSFVSCCLVVFLSFSPSFSLSLSLCCYWVRLVVFANFFSSTKILRLLCAGNKKKCN